MESTSDEEIVEFRIDPLEHGANMTYLVGLIVWNILVLALVVVSLFHQIWILAIFGGLMLMMVVPYLIFERNKTEALRISPQGLTFFSGDQQCFGGIVLPRSAKLRLTLEFVESSGESESVSTLNLWEPSTGFRQIIGLWVKQEARETLYDELLAFLEDSGFSVEGRNDISEKESQNEKSSMGDDSPE